MTDSGLSTRLRQQHRRAGLMVGVTMGIVIAICIFGAAVLFAALSQPFSDLIPMAGPVAPVQTPAAEPASSGGGSDQNIAAAQAPADAAPTPTVAPNAEPTTAPASDDFEPNYQIGAAQSVNFRSGPSTGDSIIVALSPATPLQYLDEDAPTSNPSDGDRWMRFRTEDGQEGWVREIDTTAYQP
ncbi:MAG: SH3 domain-containing protein [Thermomicrobiales bacterium]|nr:SH3 domain-containing protein [Thermomicrobiales bacterium]